MKTLIFMTLVGCAKPPSVQTAEPSGITQFGLINVIEHSDQDSTRGDEGRLTGVESVVGKKNEPPPNRNQPALP
jgi:hypothetical protein